MARTMPTYSRIAGTGRSIFVPYQFSTVTWCDTPEPEDHPAAGELVDRGGLLRGRDRRARVDRQHAVPSLIRSVAAA